MLQRIANGVGAVVTTMNQTRSRPPDSKLQHQDTEHEPVAKRSRTASTESSSSIIAAQTKGPPRAAADALRGKEYSTVPSQLDGLDTKETVAEDGREEDVGAQPVEDLTALLVEPLLCEVFRFLGEGHYRMVAATSRRFGEV